MGAFALFLTGLSLSMDAFAVAVCKGLSISKRNIRYGLLVGLFFGGFQAFMPVIGWLVGSRFSKLIEGFDHWVVFFLLTLIGIKMLFDTGKKDQSDSGSSTSLMELFSMALATSIDALAVGIGFGVINVHIGKAASIIGLTTFTISTGGFFLGRTLGDHFKNAASYVGGAVLIGLGIWALLKQYLHIF